MINSLDPVYKLDLSTLFMVVLVGEKEKLAGTFYLES